MRTHTLMFRFPFMLTYHINIYLAILKIDMDQVVSLSVARGGWTMCGHTRPDDPRLKSERFGTPTFVFPRPFVSPRPSYRAIFACSYPYLNVAALSLFFNGGEQTALSALMPPSGLAGVEVHINTAHKWPILSGLAWHVPSSLCI